MVEAQAVIYNAEYNNFDNKDSYIDTNNNHILSGILMQQFVECRG